MYSICIYHIYIYTYTMYQNHHHPKSKSVHFTLPARPPGCHFRKLHLKVCQRVGRLMKSNDWNSSGKGDWGWGQDIKKGPGTMDMSTHLSLYKKTSQRWIFGMFSRIELVWNWRLCRREPRKCMEKIRWIGGEERIVSAEVWCAWTASTVSKWRIKVDGLKNHPNWIASPTSSKMLSPALFRRRIGISGLPQHWPPAWRYQRASQLAPWQNGSTGAMETVKRKWFFKNVSITHPQFMHFLRGRRLWTHFSSLPFLPGNPRWWNSPQKKPWQSPVEHMKLNPGNPFPAPNLPPPTLGIELDHSGRFNAPQCPASTLPSIGMTDPLPGS